MVEEETLVAILEGFLDRLNEVAGVEPVDSVRIHYHNRNEVLDWAYFDPKTRSVNIAAELVEAALEDSEFREVAEATSYHEWGHGFTELIAVNVGDKPNISISLEKLARGEFDTTDYDPVDREKLVAAVEALHEQGLFEYDGLDVPAGDEIRSGEEFVSHIEEYGLIHPSNGSNDPLGHSLGDEIGESMTDSEREERMEKVVELANEIGVVSSIGVMRENPEQIERLEEMMDVPTATTVRVSHPETDSEGNEVVVEKEGLAISEPPRDEIELKRDQQRIFEGDRVTFPNPAGGRMTFEGRVIDVDPEDGSRVEFGETEVEWVQE